MIDNTLFLERNSNEAMLISSVIKDIGSIEYEAINEKEVKTLGLCDYGPDEEYCCFLSQSKYLENIRNNALVVLAKRDAAHNILELGKSVIVVENPKEVFFRLHEELCGRNGYSNPIYKTRIGANCNLSRHSIISEYNVSIGDNVWIDDNVIIKDNVEIKDNVIIRAGSIVGGQNYQTYRQEGKLKCATHVGKVVIEADVDIGYNVTIGKALYPWDNTVVGENSTVSDMAALGHGCKIGKRTQISVGVVINGRAHIGDDVWIGPKSTVSNGIAVADRGYVSIGSVVVKDVPEGKRVFGNPARVMFID